MQEQEQTDIIIKKYKDKIQDLCRCCMFQTNNTPENVFSAEFLEMFTSVTSIELKDWNNMTKIVCQSCLVQLRFLKQFLKKCKDTDAKFNWICEQIFEFNQPEVVKQEENLVFVETFDHDYYEDATTSYDLDLEETKNEIEVVHFNEEIVESKPIIYTKPKRRYKQRRILVTPLTCFTCKTKFKTKYELQEHYVENSEYCTPQQFPCKECNKVFYSRSNLENHSYVHSNELSFRCDYAHCQRMFKHEKSLKRHEETHLNSRHLVCEFCPKRFQQTRVLQQHIKRVHKDKLTIICNICDEKFVNPLGYQYHMSKVHPNGAKPIPNSPLMCPKCDKSFVTQEKFEIHLKQHVAKPKFKCDLCPKFFRGKYGLNLHKKRHLGIKTLSCDKCPMKFVNKTGLDVHQQRIHAGLKPHVCEYCGKSFFLKTRLIHHVRIHTNEKPEKCVYPFCKKVFRTKVLLRRHERAHMKRDDPKTSTEVSEINPSSTPEEKLKILLQKGSPFDCQLCPKTFASKWHLSVHLKRHLGIKEFACTECPLKCVTKDNLLAHLRTHSSDKRYICIDCKKSFVNATQLRDHTLRIHTVMIKNEENVLEETPQKIEEPETDEEVEEPPKETPFNCNICLQSFKTQPSLDVHLEEHLTISEKEFTCEKCPRKFATKEKLILHLVIHKDQKIHICNICDRMFNNSTKLKYHMRIHNDEKPEKCSYCDRFFRTPPLKKRHELIHIRKGDSKIIFIDDDFE